MRRRLLHGTLSHAIPPLPRPLFHLAFLGFVTSRKRIGTNPNTSPAFYLKEKPYAVMATDRHSWLTSGDDGEVFR